jgi:hypothetical protein
VRAIQLPVSSPDCPPKRFKPSDVKPAVNTGDFTWTKHCRILRIQERDIQR